MPGAREYTQFEKDLMGVLNKHSKENTSNTPDFALMFFLVGCLDAWNNAMFSRETYYGREIKTPLEPANK